MDNNFILREPLPGNKFRNNLTPYLSGWYLFLISMVVCIAAAWTYLNYVTPLYKITSTLQIPDDKKGDGILKATAFSDLNMFQETKTVDNEMEVLRSKDLIYKVLSKLHMETSFFDESGFTTKELYGAERPFTVTINQISKIGYAKKLYLQPYTQDKFVLKDENKSWIYSYNQMIRHKDYSFKVEKGPARIDSETPILIQFKNLTNLASSYSAGLLQVNPVIKESNTLTLSLVDAVPERGVDILNNIISTYNAENVVKKNVTAVNTILFIDKRLNDLEHDLSFTEGDIETFKQHNGAAEINASTQVNITKSAEYNQLIEEANTQLGIIKSIETYLKSSANQYNAVPSTMGLKDPSLNTLVSRFNDLQLERNRMLTSANLENPLVQNLSNQISALRINILENLQNIKKGFAISHKLLSDNSAQYDSRIRSVPSIERGLLQRSREQGVKTNLYQYLLQKREETALSLSATIPSSQLIDKPAANPTAEFPKTQLTYLFAIIAGLFTPGIFIFMKDKLSVKIKDQSSLLNIQGVKILGELCHNNEDKNSVVISNGSNTNISELFRYIRSNIGFLNQGTQHKTILVTSSMKGEGKTFFSINLGLTLAMLNKRVLIMEFDLRKPDLLKNINLEQSLGINDFLTGNTNSPADCVQAYSESENLFVMGSGTKTINPAELLSDKRLDLLFKWCKTEFDYIVLDTSPVGAVADAFSLAKYAELSIYIVRYNYTNTEQLSILRDIYDNKKLNNVMVVFNDAKKENRTAYAYGSYGYASAYGS
ncbi:GumC family protein [Mucilaginibacter rubeus]|uniref:non-specific protein-tyrosine kinase n=1 Tax=Mucilaginibacter rubeus TaxID=2027860 RepID=A0A5C1I0T7_9SPHI|nr:polysaccharide biosynthesis tyrosine autokinase [Mucilaginibacter rubeus]QEM10950.1 polysaccharide biosynthesis tyrosine autokinase [Mucilaginibacter rubeus]